MSERGLDPGLDPGLDSGLDRTTRSIPGCELDEMSSDYRRFLFCTYEHCHDGLNSKNAAGGSGVAAGPSSTACTDHTGINAEHLAGSLPIPTSCPATRKQKGVSDSSAKALRKGPQYDRNWAGKK